MKRYLLALLFAFACGAPQDGDTETDTGTGTTSEDFTSQVASGTGARNFYGFLENAGPQGNACTTLASQVAICAVPGNNQIGFALTAAAATAIGSVTDEVIASANSQLGASGWAFSRSPTGLVGVKILSLGQPLNDNIDSYYRVIATLQGGSFSGPAQCNAGPCSGATWGGLSLAIDDAAIKARAPDPAQQLVLRRHVVAHAMLLAAGVGAGSVDGFCSSRNVLPLTTTKVLLTSAELCRTKAFNFFPGGQVVFSTSAHCGN